MAKGGITLEFLLCLLIVLMVLSSVIDIEINLKEKLEKLPDYSVRVEAIKRAVYKENNWYEYEGTGCCN